MGLRGHEAMGRVPDTRYGAGEAGEQGGAIGLGELKQVAGQDLRHTSHLSGDHAQPARDRLQDGDAEGL